MFRKRWLRTTVLVVGVATASVLSPRPASAFLGIGDIVFDPQFVLQLARALTTANSVWDQLQTAQSQWSHIQNMSHTFGSWSLGSLASYVRSDQVTQQQIAALGYTGVGPQAMFDQGFPEVSALARQLRPTSAQTVSDERQVLQNHVDANKAMANYLQGLQGKTKDAIEQGTTANTDAQRMQAMISLQGVTAESLQRIAEMQQQQNGLLVRQQMQQQDAQAENGAAQKLQDDRDSLQARGQQRTQWMNRMQQSRNANTDNQPFQVGSRVLQGLPSH